MGHVRSSAELVFSRRGEALNSLVFLFLSDIEGPSTAFGSEFPFRLWCKESATALLMGLRTSVHELRGHETAGRRRGSRLHGQSSSHAPSPRLVSLYL